MDNNKKEIKKDKQFVEDIVAEIKADYKNRLEEKRHLEAQWQLNSNFLLGNQYCAITLRGEISDCAKDYYWQEREIYNHIAPIVEMRLAKLSKVRPKMSIRPATSSSDDISTASAASKVLSSAYHKLNIDNILIKGTQWSELTGSVFYKLSWDKNAGKLVGYKDGNPVHEGDVRIDVCPPYEIYPSSITCSDIEDCDSIIHAKALHIDDIERIWGKNVLPEDIDSVCIDNVSIAGGLGVTGAIPKLNRVEKKEHAVVIERYVKPSLNKPEGELAIICGNKLLHYSSLPFRCGEDNSYAFPFIKQDCQVYPGSFFGVSIIERVIPVQRAYNAIKNRKHEFMNRIAMGVLAVEDGSVDTDNLESEGLSPGKILIYRQGATLPKFLENGQIPSDFSLEEDKLLNEFVMISGVSEVMRSSSTPNSVTSGTAIQLLLEQDDARLSSTAERIKIASKCLAKYILRLYKQFAKVPRLSRFVGEKGEIELLNWRSSNLTSDDIIFETDNEVNDSPASRKSMLFDLLRIGLFNDEKGHISLDTRKKILDILGFNAILETQEEASKEATQQNEEEKEEIKEGNSTNA